jgi:hypothetical protein
MRSCAHQEEMQQLPSHIVQPFDLICGEDAVVDADVVEDAYF